MPFSISAYCTIILALLTLPAGAQQFLSGKVRRRSSQEILPSVSVINHTQQKTNISDMGGNYRIRARPGDTLTFSSAGYRPDTAIIASWMFADSNGYAVYLQPNVV